MAELRSDLEWLYAAWADALVARDADWFRRIEREDFIYVAPDGRVMDREAHSSYASQGVRGRPASSVRDIANFGDVVVVGGEHRIVRMDDPGAGSGSTGEARVQFTSVWAVTAGELLLVRHHTTLTTPLGS